MKPSLSEYVSVTRLLLSIALMVWVFCTAQLSVSFSLLLVLIACELNGWLIQNFRLRIRELEKRNRELEDEVYNRGVPEPICSLKL